MPRKKAVPPTPEEAIQLLLNAELNGRTVRELAVDAASYELLDMLKNSDSYKELDAAGLFMMPMFDYEESEIYYVLKVAFPKKVAAWLPDVKKAALVLVDYSYGIHLDGTPYQVFADYELAKPATPAASKPIANRKPSTHEPTRPYSKPKLYIVK